MSHENEYILVVERALFDKLGAFQGLCPEPDAYFHHLLAPENNRFLRRDLAEEDPGFKQIIPYCLFHHRGRVLCYTRGTKGGEARLHALDSIGIGGHVDRDDAGEEHRGETTYLAGVEREIAEEVRFTGGHTQRVVGLLNDDSNAVGRVHLGIIHWIDLEAEDPQMAPNEAPIVDPRFLTPSELRGQEERLETWSRFCLPALEAWMG